MSTVSTPISDENVTVGSGDAMSSNEENAVTTDLPITEGAQATGEALDLDSKWVRWRCLVCEYTYEGKQVVIKCPRCGNADPDKFGDE